MVDFGTTRKGIYNFLLVLVINSNLAPFQSYCRFSADSSNPTPILHTFWGVPLGVDRRRWAPRSEYHKLIIRVINFEVNQPIVK